MDRNCGIYTIPSYIADHEVNIYETNFHEEPPNIPESIMTYPINRLLFISRVFNTPSHRLYYYDITGKIKIPYAAVNPKRIREDIWYWKPLFNKQSMCQTPDEQSNYDALLNGQDAHPDFIKTHEYEQSLIDHPYSGLNLQLNGNPIKEVLENHGVYHLFIPKDISAYNFLLTRNYGIVDIYNTYNYNPMDVLYAQAMLTLFSEDKPDYKILESGIPLHILDLLLNQQNDELLNIVQSPNINRLYISLGDYINQENHETPNKSDVYKYIYQLSTYLPKYTDIQIQSLVDQNLDDIPSRKKFIEKVIENIQEEFS